MSDSYKHIKSLAESHKAEPPTGAWDRLEYKLQSDRTSNQKKKLHLIRFWFSIAASLMIIITCSYIIYSESRVAPDYKAGHIAEWEDIGIESDYLYSVQAAREINKISVVKSKF